MSSPHPGALAAPGAPPPPTVRWAAWRELDPDLAYALLRLRVDVFVVEQACAYPELDGRDVEAGTRHAWVDGAGAGRPELPVAACLRLLVDEGREGDDDGALRIGRVVTAPAARGRGLSGALLDDVVARHGEVPLVLDAQAHLAGWYARRGFAATGPEFVEDGIPHVPMRRVPRRP